MQDANRFVISLCKLYRNSISAYPLWPFCMEAKTDFCVDLYGLLYRTLSSIYCFVWSTLGKFPESAECVMADLVEFGRPNCCLDGCSPALSARLGP